MPRFFLFPAALATLLAFLLIGCSAHSEQAPSPETAALALEATLPEWQELSERLTADGLDAEKTAALYEKLSPPSPVPMGVKVRELYTNKFLAKQKTRPRQKNFSTKLGIPGPWFKGVVTRANALRCKAFIKEYAPAFALAESRYGIPPEIGAALLFVETRLGSYLGKESAFFSLSSMTVTKAPADISEYLGKLPGSMERLPWIQERMEQKAEWAYTELKALLEYCFENGLDPLTLSGSLYGAIGLCQFMPSNISLCAADGDGDGRIDIFQAPDAIASLSHYLKMHGWKPGLNLHAQVKVLRRYNAMNIYAHTILALAKTIRQLS